MRKSGLKQAKNEFPAGTKPFKQIGFYGCNNQIVRVRTRVLRKGQTKHRVECSACGRKHLVSVMWRKRGRKERLNSSVSV